MVFLKGFANDYDSYNRAAGCPAGRRGVFGQRTLLVKTLKSKTTFGAAALALVLILAGCAEAPMGSDYISGSMTPGTLPTGSSTTATAVNAPAPHGWFH
jgi:hypothetical protein